MRTASFLLLYCTFCSGCATYEYDLTRPPDLAQHIANKQTISFPLDPLEYRMTTLDNRLIIQIYNPTDDSIQLLGPQSSAVDAHNQSHPFRSQTAAPKSFIKLILPPP